MLFNSIPPYLKQGAPFSRVRTTVQSQSRSLKENSILDEDRRKCSCPTQTPQQQDTHVIITKPLPVLLDHHIIFKGDWRRAHLLDHPWVPITLSLIRPGRTSHCSNNKISDIHSEVSATTGSCLPFSMGAIIFSNLCRLKF